MASIQDLMPTIKHTADLVKGELWDSLEEEDQQAHLELMAPVAVSQGVTPEMVNDYLSGEYDKLQSDFESVSGQISSESAHALDSTIDTLISFFRSDSAFCARTLGKRLLVNRLGDNTIIASVIDSSDPGVPRLEITYDPEGLVYAKAEQSRTKAFVNMEAIYWAGETDDIEAHGSDSSVDSEEDVDYTMHDDSLEDSL